jgi:putative transposase
VVWPRRDGELSDFGHWLTLIHSQRWHAHYHDVGMGHLYQGRFKSFPVASDEHYLRLCHYEEGNALRVGLVKAAEAWPFASLWRRQQNLKEHELVLSDGPVPFPRNWVQEVNCPQTVEELQALRTSVQRGQPYGNEACVRRTVQTLGLETTMRPRGRPPKQQSKSQR